MNQPQHHPGRPSRRPKSQESSPPDWHPYRVRRDPNRGGAPLTAPQRRILAALVHRCPRPGEEVTARVLHGDTRLRLGSLVLSLRHLATQRLVVEHPPESEGAESTFSPSLLGRTRVRG